MNSLLRPGAPSIDELARLGMARVSMGSFLQRAALQWVEEVLAAVRDGRAETLWERRD